MWLAAVPVVLFGVSPALAQAPPAAPIVLGLAPSARVAALAGAWVAGRDQDVIFYNPAQLVGVRPDFAVSAGRIGNASRTASLSSAYAAGKLSLTLGWGVQFVNFETASGQAPPFSPDVLLGSGVVDAQSLLATAGAAVEYKSVKMGSAVKYLSDRTTVNASAMAVDIGVSRNLFGGVGAFAVQNLGPRALDEALPEARLPRQIAGGWSGTRAAGPFDLAYFTQLTHRKDWTAPAVGLEAGYSWLEGYTVTGRVGARRPDTDAESPLSLGGAFTLDRVTLEYAMRFFDDSRRAHLVTLRWR